jgi:acetyltransferase-like isoleucine patch superfamily enzyme
MKTVEIVKFVVNFLKPKNLASVLKAFKSFCEETVFEKQKLSKDATSFIHPTVNFRCAENIYLGKQTRIQPGTFLWASPKSRIVLGDFSGIGPGCKFFSSNHSFAVGRKYIEQPWQEADILIGQNVWIGAGSILTAGVQVGDGSVIAAGSVVTKDIPPNSLAAGIPAKIIRNGERMILNHSK